MCLALVTVTLATPLAAQEFPELSGRVVDAADIIPENIERLLTEKAEALETETQRQLVIATVPDLQGYDIADFGYRLGREWGIGDADRNDGVPLLVAPNERRVRIEVGYGLEGILTDAYASTVVQNAILPRFREDDYPGGITAGTAALVTTLSMPDDLAMQLVDQQTRKSASGSPIWVLPMILAIPWVLLVLVVIAFLKVRNMSREWYGSSPSGTRISTYSGSNSSSLSGSSWSSGSSFSSSSSSFSGGGGSFGGGGSSGSW